MIALSIDCVGVIGGLRGCSRRVGFDLFRENNLGFVGVEFCAKTLWIGCSICLKVQVLGAFGLAFRKDAALAQLPKDFSEGVSERHSSCAVASGLNFGVSERHSSCAVA